MIKLSLTKDKIISLIKIIQAMILDVQYVMPAGDLLQRMETNVHLLNLQDLQYQLMTKYLNRCRPLSPDKPVQVSINYNQGFVLVKYRGLREWQGYELLVSEQITPVITKHLEQ